MFVWLGLCRRTYRRVILSRGNVSNLSPSNVELSKERLISKSWEQQAEGRTGRGESALPRRFPGLCQETRMVYSLHDLLPIQISNLGQGTTNITPERTRKDQGRTGKKIISACRHGSLSLQCQFTLALHPERFIRLQTKCHGKLPDPV